jgi:hypothetical protein
MAVEKLEDEWGTLLLLKLVLITTFRPELFF